jgi:hypothetical protein
MKVSEQYQLGAIVILDKVGIITKVVGYEFDLGYDGMEVRYKLDCDYTASRSEIRDPRGEDMEAIKRVYYVR